MKIAVIGAGWAGLAATQVLLQAGHQVTVFELSHQLGGRARGMTDPHLGSIDNGQHLLIGAYRHTLALIRDAHPAPDTPAFWRLPLNLISADHAIRIQTRNPRSGRLARLLGLWQAKGLSLSERWQIITLLARLSLGRARPAKDQTVADWLQQHHQNPRTRQLLWTPLCLATMNTDPSIACAHLFARILQDSLLSPESGATDLIIPRCDLTDLWAATVASRAQLQFGTHIEQVTPLTSTDISGIGQAQVLVHEQYYDGCIVATPPPATRKIARHWPDSLSLCQMLDQFSFEPITTCYVRLDRPLRLPYPMQMLSSGHGPGASGIGQWVFDRHFILQSESTHPGTEQNAGLLAFVISHAGPSHFDRETLAQDLVQQLWQELQRSQNDLQDQTTPKVLHSRIITEKRATFSAIPGLARPSSHTPWPHIKLAGDWTDTGYPAVLEGAVISGMKAARSLLQTLTSATATTTD